MESIVVRSAGCDLERTFSCGQAFRWHPVDGGWMGVAGDKPLFATQQGKRILLDAPEQDRAFWRHYFSLDRDYSAVEELLAAEEKTAACLPYSQGIRILRQDPYETLISFILSANNNVRRIQGIVERLCTRFGVQGTYRGREYFSFPRAEVLAAANEEEVTACGAGYRAPYVIQSAARVAGCYDLSALSTLSFDQAKRELMTFPGVCPKVAECVMLFSMGFDSAFPVDVWVRRISNWLYPGEAGPAAARAAAERFGCWAGAAQQYLFHYARQVGLKG